MLSLSIVGEHGLCLVLPSPERPCQNEGWFEAWRHEKSGDECSDFGDSGDEVDLTPQAAIDVFGLGSFGLPEAERRKSARNLARKAAATMTSVM